jgi:hypothetical protein
MPFPLFVGERPWECKTRLYVTYTGKQSQQLIIIIIIIIIFLGQRIESSPNIVNRDCIAV